MRYASRKFLLALGSLASATVLVYLGSISDAVYGTVMGTVVLSYVAGNVAQKATAKAPEA